MRWVLSLVLCSVVFSSAAFANPRDPNRDGGPRLRPQDPRSTLYLNEGIARSSTFRALVDRLEDSNVIVYVHVSPFIKSTLAGQLTWMTQAGPYRYLRATLSPDQTTDQAIATLAHELQHAVEVVEDTQVISEATLVSLYKRIGLPSNAAATMGWETVAAQETGYQVRRELVGAAEAAIVARLGSRDHM